MRIRTWLAASVPLVLVMSYVMAQRAETPPSDRDKQDVEVLPMEPVDAEELVPVQSDSEKESAGSGSSTAPTVIAGDRSNIQFADNAFPPPLPDTAWHRDAWMRNDCMRCHETGVADAPEVKHRNMPDVLMTAKCRSCHVLIPGLLPRSQREAAKEVKGKASRFDDNAFPPMMPNSESHQNAWNKDDCLMCHTRGIQGAPLIRHENLPKILLQSKCRSCHVQTRAIETPVAPKVGER